MTLGCLNQKTLKNKLSELFCSPHQGIIMYIVIEFLRCDRNTCENKAICYFFISDWLLDIPETFNNPQN